MSSSSLLSVAAPALLLLLLGGVAAGGSNTYSINSASDLIQLPDNVVSGTSYEGTTVFLENDIEFTEELSGEFKPIGRNTTYPFRGEFDGQGHIIKNLNMSLSLNFVGFFGSSKRGSFKSVVFDSSCSFASLSGNSNSGRTGSLIGWCNNCTIENIVNMGSVSSARTTISHLWVGGIVGDLALSGSGSNNNMIKNCVNYGSVTFSGSSGSSTYIGGIAGESYGRIVSNCANYGNIINAGNTSYLLLVGGITGNIGNANVWVIENCLSAGKITSSGPSNGSCIGSIVGNIDRSVNATITHCIWTGDVGYDNAYGSNISNFEMTDTYEIVSLNTTTMEELNEYTKQDSTLSKWLVLNLTDGKINSNINQDVLVATQNHFPDPVKEGHTFRFWSAGAECTEEYHHNTTGISGVHACFEANTYTVSFDYGNGTVVNRRIMYGERYNAPDVMKTGYTFSWYSEEGGEGRMITADTVMSTACDHMIYGHFTINNYVLTFIYGNWTEPDVRTIKFNATIDYPEGVGREGYRFTGWSNNISTMPAHDLNITARWIEKVDTFVEIVFASKDLTKEDAEKIIKEYTNDNFVIERFEVDGESGDVKAIIKFTDKNEAESFMRAIESGERASSFIKRIEYADGHSGSFTSEVAVNLFILLALIVLS